MTHLTGAQVRQAIAGANIRARARTAPLHGAMNKVEAAYATHLDLQKLVGQVLRYDFQKLTLRIGPDCRYTTDFVVMLPDGTLAFDDPKGAKKRKDSGQWTYWIEEDARVKIATAAQQFPQFLFRIVWLTPDGWQYREIGATV